MRQLILAALFLSVPLWAPREARAHSTCMSSSGCSPHCASASDTGCDFYNCNGYIGGNNWSYHRSVSCPPGSDPSNNNCPGYYVCTDAWADSDTSPTSAPHNVNTGGLSCSAWPC